MPICLPIRLVLAWSQRPSNACVGMVTTSLKRMCWDGHNVPQTDVFGRSQGPSNASECSSRQRHSHQAQTPGCSGFFRGRHLCRYLRFNRVAERRVAAATPGHRHTLHPTKGILTVGVAERRVAARPANRAQHRCRVVTVPGAREARKQRLGSGCIWPDWSSSV